MSDPVPEADRVAGAPHPRETAVLFGQGAAEQAFLMARNAGRLHHAWLITGPRGVGKATLAWRIARALIAGAATLDMDPADPVFRRCAALSEPRLFLLRRAWDAKGERLKGVIDVDETRRLKGFLQLSATDGGWRVVIVDAAEEMNTAAANALLKALEEPPARVAFLLVSHQPARLLPTIRSRTRPLTLGPLAPGAVLDALAAAGADVPGEGVAVLAGGAVGEALRMVAEGGDRLYADILGVLATLPRLDRPRLLALCDRVQGREAAALWELAGRLVPLALARAARAGVVGPGPEAVEGEAALLARLVPDRAAAFVWAEASGRIGTRMAAARAANLDPAQVLLDTFLDIETLGAAAAAAS